MKQKTLVILDTYRTRFPTTSKLLSIIYNVLVQQKINLSYRLSIMPLIRKLLKEENTKLYSFDMQSSTNLSSKCINFETLNSIKNKKSSKEIEQECSDFIRGLGENCKEFREVTSYGDISFWDLVQFDTWSYLKRRLETLENVISIINKERPKKIVVLDRYTDLGKACIISANYYNISIVDKTTFFSFLLNQIKKIILPLTYKLTKPWGVGRLNLNDKKSNNYENGKKKISLFGNYLFPSKLLTLWSNKTNAFDIRFIHLGNVDKIRKEKISNLSFSDIAGYGTYDLIKKINKRSAELIAFWRKSKNNEEFANKFVYQHLEIYPLIEELLDYYFRYDFKEILKYLELSKQVFLIEKPVLNVSYDEIGRVSKCINYSAKKSGVKTILIQHGALAEYPLYGSFCADIFALYGENSARIYKNLGVEDKQLKIVGNIRFDELFSKMKSYNRESTLNKIGVQTNKKVILFTSQPVTYEENELLLNEIFSEFSKLPKENYHLVIKLHPAEDGRLHNNIAKSFDNYTIIKDIDIFEIIHASDLVITYWSTTGLEAMVLGKPVIVLNLSGKPDKVAYARTGAALGVYKKGHLKQSILKCLYNLALRKKMFDKQKNFIFSESYKIDGKASERIINLINEMIKT